MLSLRGAVSVIFLKVARIATLTLRNIIMTKRVVADNLREITLVVDDLWYDAIVNLTSEVYDGETCDWLRVEVI